MRLSNDIFFAEVERMLSAGEQVSILVKGFSMTPLLRNGRDKAILRRAEDNDIRLGQVMLFRHRGAHVLHRVIKIEGDQITFAGDGNYKIRETAERKDIVGVMIAIERPSGKRVECTDHCWRAQSSLWLALPPIARRVILGIRRRLIA